MHPFEGLKDVLGVPGIRNNVVLVCADLSLKTLLLQKLSPVKGLVHEIVSVMPANADGANLVIAGCIPKLLLARPSTHQRHRLAYTRQSH